MHFISSPEAGKKDIPLLLSNKKPTAPSNSGVETASATTLNKSPEAVVLGLGYTNETVDELREACKDVTKPVPWISGGLSQKQFSGVVGTLRPTAEQGPLTAEMVKKVLVRVKAEGKFGRDGVFHWWERADPNL